MATNELGDYILEEQIEYTCEYMENQHIKDRLVNMGDTSKLVRLYLSHYR